MDAELKRKWVEALRSGEYKQGRGELLNDEGAYCCLGVLCAMQGEHAGLLRNVTVFVPPVSRAGLLGYAHALARMNDGSDDGVQRPMSFAEIADYIEANL